MVDLSRRINRLSGFLPYFFSPAVQLRTTVMGVGDASPLWVLTDAVPTRGY
jgi:hypothetical protein